MVDTPLSGSDGRKPMGVRLSPAAPTLFENPVMKRTIEIRSAEGGDDAKLLVGELAVAYEKGIDRKG
jgi:protein subunit release factor A